MENVSEFYFEKLGKAPNPGHIITALYGSLYDYSTTRSEIIMFNKLVKVFGRFTVFFSVIDMAGSYPDRIDNPYALLYTICKSKFERTHNSVFKKSSEPLDKFINNINEEVTKVKKAWKKIPEQLDVEEELDGE